MDFSGKRVLITGASRGIGRATAELFAQKGAKVAINYRSNHNEANKTMAALAGDGHCLVPTDISKEAEIKKMVEEAVSKLGGIDILVNNAAIFSPHPITNCSFEEWQNSWNKTIGINLLGTAHVTYCVVQEMLKTGGGRIVNVSSRGAFRGEPEQPAYGASKAGLNAMSQSLAQALAPHNIFIGTVAPGFVNTEMAGEILSGPLGDSIRSQSPLNRVAEPDEVAWCILFLASEQSKFTTGAILDINGASYLRT